MKISDSTLSKPTMVDVVEPRSWKKSLGCRTRVMDPLQNSPLAELVVAKASPLSFFTI